MPEIVNDPDGSLEGKFDKPEQPVTYTAEQVAQMLDTVRAEEQAKVATPAPAPAPTPEPAKPEFNVEDALKRVEDQVKVLAARPTPTEKVAEPKPEPMPSALGDIKVLEKRLEKELAKSGNNPNYEWINPNPALQNIDISGLEKPILI